MGGVIPRPLLRPLRVVQRLGPDVGLVLRDPPVAQAERLLLLHDELLVELQVPFVARIPVLAAPDLMPRRRVAPENSKHWVFQLARRVHQVRVIRRVRPVFDLDGLLLELLVQLFERPELVSVDAQRLAPVQQAPLHEEVGDAVLGQKLVHAFAEDGFVRHVRHGHRGRPLVAGPVGALGQPVAARSPPEMALVRLNARLHLRLQTRILRQQGRIAVCRAAGDDLNMPRVLKRPERADDVPPVLALKAGQPPPVPVLPVAGEIGHVVVALAPEQRLVRLGRLHLAAQVALTVRPESSGLEAVPPERASGPA